MSLEYEIIRDYGNMAFEVNLYFLGIHRQYLVLDKEPLGAIMRQMWLICIKYPALRKAFEGGFSSETEALLRKKYYGEA